jgi:hypothetical protein
MRVDVKTERLVQDLLERPIIQRCLEQISIAEKDAIIGADAIAELPTVPIGDHELEIMWCARKLYYSGLRIATAEHRRLRLAIQFYRNLA